MEAIIAALYLDAGMEVASAFIHRLLLDGVDLTNPARSSDYKTALQELIQRRSGQVLTYELAGESGPDHAKTFHIRVLLNGTPIGEGTGHTKKEAEQAAARCALEAQGQ